MSDRTTDDRQRGPLARSVAWSLVKAQCADRQRSRLGWRGLCDGHSERLGQASIAPVVHVQAISRHERLEGRMLRPDTDSRTVKRWKDADVLSLGRSRNQGNLRSQFGLPMTRGRYCRSIKTTSAPVAFNRQQPLMQFSDVRRQRPVAQHQLVPTCQSNPGAPRSRPRPAAPAYRRFPRH